MEDAAACVSLENRRLRGTRRQRGANKAPFRACRWSVCRRKVQGAEYRVKREKRKVNPDQIPVSLPTMQKRSSSRSLRAAGAAVPVPARPADALAPLRASTLLGIFHAALDSNLIERGAARAIELLGSVDDFWQALALFELQRMAAAGNHQAQAELAWRHAAGEGGAEKSYPQAAHWATLSAEHGCAAGAAVLGWLLYNGFGLPGDLPEAARLFASAAARDDLRGLTWLGLCLLHGHGVAADGRQALAMFRQAAAKGGATARLAQYWLGRIHYFGLPGVVPGDFSEAARWLCLAAGHGHHGAGELLARCHFFGRGLRRDRREALRLWRAAAAGGDAQAMYCVGMCLYAGEGGAPDGAEAMSWLRAAARQQVAGAMFLLGQCYVFGVGVTRDIQTGLGWYRRAAEQGNREAEYELGEWHAFGRGGLAQDMAEAIRWYRRAARQGHAQAQRKLGHCYRNGDGVTENKAQALVWYRRAAAGGDATARVWLGECYEQGEGVARDAVAAAQHYRVAAQADDPHGMAEYGRCLLHGIGMAADFAQAERFLRAAAEAGWQPALGELERYCYFRAGQLLRESADGGAAAASCAAEAVSCYRKAGELGHRQAAFMLGECYRHGHGAPRDDLQAMTWYRKAARLFAAKIALGDLYYFGYGAHPVRQDHREALRWYEQAVEQHEDAYAMYSLGYCLLHGQGCAASPQNAREGARWLRKAATLGHVEAQYELGCAYLRGTGVARSLRQAIKWLRSAAQLGHAAAQAALAELTEGRTEGRTEGQTEGRTEA